MLAKLAIGFVAFEHLLFLVLEMFLWTKPAGRRIFGLSAQVAQGSRALAANQGLYNGFLAAGLIWSLYDGIHAQVFFLTCVIIAGIFGAITAKRTILWVQALPAAVALLLVWFANGS
jgi:putative membrane protein